MPGPTVGGMYLENLVVDAVEPQRLGRFWEAVLGGERLTDEPDGFETRLAVEGGPVLDLCFQRVPEPAVEPPRLHLDLLGGQRQTRWSSGCSGWAHDTSTSVSATCPGWCSPTRRATPAASWRIERCTPTPDPSRRSRSTLPSRTGMRILVLADRLDRRGRRRTPVPAPPVAARSPPRAVPRAGPQGDDQEPAAPRRPARDRRRPRRVAAGIAERGGARAPPPGVGRAAVALLHRSVRQRVLRPSGAVVGHGPPGHAASPRAADPGVRLRTSACRVRLSGRRVARWPVGSGAHTWCGRRARPRGARPSRHREPVHSRRHGRPPSLPDRHLAKDHMPSGSSRPAPARPSRTAAVSARCRRAPSGCRRAWRGPRSSPAWSWRSR